MNGPLNLPIFIPIVLFPVRPSRDGSVAGHVEVAKMAAESLPEPTPAMWIRVGPGKFVRADVHVHAFDNTHIEEPLADALHSMDASTEAMPAQTARADLEQERCALEPLEPTLDGERIAASSVDLTRQIGYRRARYHTLCLRSRAAGLGLGWRC